MSATVVCVLLARLAVCAGLRAAHRRGLLTERAVVVGAGTFGAYIAALLREHPEFGLNPVGFVDDGPPRRDLPVPSLGTMRDLAGRHPPIRDRAGRRLLFNRLPR